MDLTNAEKAYRQIKEKIVTIEMRPGSVVRESALMNELQLGRTPIREALKRLQADNLVVVKSRRGIFVADIAITDLTQIYEVRVEMEALAARLAARRRRSEELETMHHIVEQCNLTDPTDLKSLFSLDREFHGMLAQASQNALLCKEMEHLYNLSLRIWYIALDYITSADVDVNAHIGILAAIEEGDVEEADRRIRTHIEHFQAAIKTHL